MLIISMLAGFDMLVWGAPNENLFGAPKILWSALYPLNSISFYITITSLMETLSKLKTSLHPPSSHLHNLFFLPSCQFSFIPPSIPLTVTVGLLLPLFLSGINKTCLCLVTYGHSSLWHTNHIHTYLIYKCVCVCVCLLSISGTQRKHLLTYDRSLAFTHTLHI